MSTVTSTPPSTLAESVLIAQRYLRSLHGPSGLRTAAEQVAAAARVMGCLTLVAASADARAVVAAATLMDRGLESRSGADGTDKVLVVEAAAITGHHVRRHVCEVRESGAHWVGVLVLHAGGAVARASDGETASMFGDVDDATVLPAR